MRSKVMQCRQSASKKIRTYSELITFKTFEERFEYLKLGGKVGNETFGFDRYLNQTFYKSKEWRQLRYQIIARDCGRDLAMDGYEMAGRIYIHHMNPITVEDIINVSEYLLNPDFLVCVSFETHNAIHYGNEDNLIPRFIERKPNDTCPWKH